MLGLSFAVSNNSPTDFAVERDAQYALNGAVEPRSLKINSWLEAALEVAAMLLDLPGVSA